MIAGQGCEKTALPGGFFLGFFGGYSIDKKSRFLYNLVLCDINMPTNRWQKGGTPRGTTRQREQNGRYARQ